MTKTLILKIIFVGLICPAIVFAIFKLVTFERNCDTITFHGWAGKLCCKFCEARGGSDDWREKYADDSVKCSCMNGEYTIFRPKYIESGER